MAIPVPQYVVEYEGKLYGPFTTNNGTGSSSTDAVLFRNNNTPGAPIMLLWPSTAYEPPFPITEESG